MKCPKCGGDGVITFSKMDKNGYFNDAFFAKYCSVCHGTGEVQTNEEWFCQLSTEEKAKVLRRRTYGNSEDNESVEQGWVNWLKAKHEDNPPDIPSVPSWDKWLQGEKTKCEYCDGNSTECELVGRSECPRTPKTEQQYIQTCNTEQLAELITDIRDNDIYANNGFLEPLIMKLVGVREKKLRKSIVVEWLKQPHTTIKE